MIQTLKKIFQKEKRGFCIIETDGKIHTKVERDDENIILFETLEDAKNYAVDNELTNEHISNYRYLNHNLKTNVATIHKLSEA